MKPRKNFEDFVMRNEDGSILGYIEEDMLAYLLEEEVCFLNSRKYLDLKREEDGSYSLDGDPQPETIVIFVSCNDVFSWACAEGEEITMKELPVLTEMYCSDMKWAVDRWACKKRNRKPQLAIQRMMKEDGSWDEEMEALGPSYEEEYQAKQKEE